MKEETPERAFLHDLGSPVSSINIVLQSLLEDFKERNKSEEAEIKMRIELALDSTRALIKLIETRRREILKTSKP